MTKSKGNIKKSVLLNAIKQLCSIMFPLITIPYVTRVIGSESYGIYNFSTNHVAYFAYIAAFGISSYAIRECSKIRDERGELDKLFSQLLNINLVTAGFACLLLYCSLLFSELIHQYWLFILIYSSTIILATIGTDWINVVFEDYGYITIRYIVIQCISLILLFLFVKKPEDVAIYCAISSFAGYGGNIANVAYVRKKVRYNIKFGFDIGKHYKSLLTFFVSSLGILIYVNSDITMVRIFLTDKDVGVYGFCSKLYGIFKTLIYSIVSTFAARMAYLIKIDREKYESYLDKVFVVLSLVLLPTCLLVGLFRREIIAIVGGKEYLSGSNVLLILMLTLPFAIMCSYFSSLILIVNNQEKIMLVSTFIASVTNILLNLYFIPHYGIIGAAITTFIAEATSFGIAFYKAKDYYSLSKINYRIYYVVMCECLFICLWALLVNILFTSTIKEYNLLKVLVVSLLSFFSYVMLAMKCKNKAFVNFLRPEMLRIFQKVLKNKLTR